MLRKMNTAFEEIVSVGHIGKDYNPFPLGTLIAKACSEELPRAEHDKTRTLLLCIDMQRDFMEGGQLGVAGSIGDTERLTRFIYRNMAKITEIAASLDTHSLRQIFHPCWWRGEDGSTPEPFTVITAKEAKEGRWSPLYEKEKSREYLEYLETGGQKRLVIWPYHCIAGTVGCALENQFSNMVHFFSAAREALLKKIVKGMLPATEFYGIVSPEYDPGGNYANRELLDDLKRCDRLVIAGEARDYCVAQSLLQICEAMEKERKRPEIFIMEDCMSCVGPDAAAVSAAYGEWADRFSFHIVRSTEDFL